MYFCFTTAVRLSAEGNDVTQAEGQRMVRALKEDFTASFANVDFTNGIAAVLRSPLLKRTGPVVPALEKLALGESTSVANKIIASFEKLISLKKPITDFLTLDVSQHQKFSDFKATLHHILKLVCFIRLVV